MSCLTTQQYWCETYKSYYPLCMPGSQGGAGVTPGLSCNYCSSLLSPLLRHENRFPQNMLNLRFNHLEIRSTPKHKHSITQILVKLLFLNGFSEFRVVQKTERSLYPFAILIDWLIELNKFVNDFHPWFPDLTATISLPSSSTALFRSTFQSSTHSQPSGNSSSSLPTAPSPF